MFPHESEAIVGFDMGDAIVDDEASYNDALPTDQSAEYEEDQEAQEAKEDAISVISEANSTKSSKSKKRVQFLPDGILVRIREIPPRSNKSSSESDGSASDSGSGSDDSDSDSSSDSETPSDRETPPPVQTVSETKFNTMPPLVWNPSAAAKGSYNVAKPQVNKQASVVAKITGIQRPPSPAPVAKSPPKRIRRTPSPKQDKPHPKRVVKQHERVGSCKNSLDNPKKPRTMKKQPVYRKEGKTSPTPHPKPSKTQPVTSKAVPGPKPSLAQRRINSAPPNKLSGTRRSHSMTTVSTSVSVLPASTEVSTDTSADRMTRAMQSLSMGQLYTMDGFIFPSHHAPDLHLPEVAPISGTRASLDALTSPRRSLDFTGDANNNHLHTSHSQQFQNLSPQSANRKKRHYAWQMANGSLQSTLQNTPSIAQLWENTGPHISHSHHSSSSETNKDKPFSNGYHKT